MIALLLLQTVWVVDDGGGPGVNFTDLPPAVAAAADGDVLLVKAGTYSHFTLSGKGLRILGEGSASTFVILATGTPTPTNTTTISNVPSTSLAYLDSIGFPGVIGASPRLRILGTTTRSVLADISIAPNFFVSALEVSGAEAHVHRSALSGGQGFQLAFLPNAPGGSGLAIDNGARVEASSCSLLGGVGAPMVLSQCPTASGDGATVLGSGPPSRPWLADSTSIGGIASGAVGCFPTFGAVGGAGLRVTDSFARVTGASTLLRGGAGACLLGIGGPPGPGLSSGPTSDTQVHPSVAIQSGGLLCNGGVVPATFGTSITYSPSAVPVLRIGGVLSNSGSAIVTLSDGAGGAPFLIALSLSPAYLANVPGFLGEILVDPANWVPLVAGNLSATGAFSVTIPLASLPPAFVNLPVYLQAIALHPSGAFFVASNSTVARVRP